MNIVLIFDQGLAGAGGKSNPNVGLTAVKGGIGSALMMESHLDKIGAKVAATLYCGKKRRQKQQQHNFHKLQPSALFGFHMSSIPFPLAGL